MVEVVVLEGIIAVVSFCIIVVVEGIIAMVALLVIAMVEVVVLEGIIAVVVLEEVLSCIIAMVEVVAPIEEVLLLPSSADIDVTRNKSNMRHIFQRRTRTRHVYIYMYVD